MNKIIKIVFFLLSCNLMVLEINCNGLNTNSNWSIFQPITNLWNTAKKENNNIIYSTLFECIKTSKHLYSYLKFNFTENKEQFRKKIKADLDERNAKEKEKVDELFDQPKSFLTKSIMNKLIFISLNVIFFAKIYPDYIKKRHWTVQTIIFFLAPEITNLILKQVGLDGY